MTNVERIEVIKIENETVDPNIDENNTDHHEGIIYYKKLNRIR
jgi:hypothetical protein